jgi:hypothetical protein
MSSTDVPLRVRVRFAHAAVQHLADMTGIDVLHIKGEAIDPSLVAPERRGTDADVLVRPRHVPLLLASLQSHQWVMRSGFETGSPFGHAATLIHPLWGYTDLHRQFPGVTVDPEEAFDLLWNDRVSRQLAGVSCSVPGLSGQVAILVLNATRSGWGRSDLRTAWEPAPAEMADAVRLLVTKLGAQVAFAAATGDLDSYRHRRDYDLWRVTTSGGGRVEEWVARIRAAPNRHAALKIALRAPLVNTQHLANRLGRQPTRREIVRAFVARGRRGIDEILEIVRRRRWRR